jgi:hypothetical protein
MLIGFAGGRIVQASWGIGSKSSDPRFLYRRHSAGLDRAVLAITGLAPAVLVTAPEVALAPWSNFQPALR